MLGVYLAKRRRDRPKIDHSGIFVLVAPVQGDPQIIAIFSILQNEHNKSFILLLLHFTREAKSAAGEVVKHTH